jgi:hypothetical protein
VEAISTHAFLPQLPRQRQTLRDDRHTAMERRVEAHDLPKRRGRRFDLPDCGERFGQMEWIERHERGELRYELCGNTSRRLMRGTAVDKPVPDGVDVHAEFPHQSENRRNRRRGIERSLRLVL